MVPVATSVSADETEALKAEITKAVEKVQEAGKTKHLHVYILMSMWQNIPCKRTVESKKSVHP